MRRFLQTYGRLVIVLIIALVVAGALGVKQYYASRNKTYEPRSACQILPPEVARQVARAPLTPERHKPIANKDTLTSFCIYRGTANSIGIVARAPKSPKGADLNQQAFASPPVASQKVYGYGKAAYWTPSLGQLNILNHDTWYIMSFGPNDPTKRSLPQTRQLADKITDKL